MKLVQKWKKQWESKSQSHDPEYGFPVYLGDVFISESSEFGFSLMEETDVSLLYQNKPYRHRSEVDRLAIRKDATVEEIIIASNNGEADDIRIKGAELRDGVLVLLSDNPGETIGKGGRIVKAISQVAGVRCKVEQWEFKGASCPLSEKERKGCWYFSVEKEKCDLEPPAKCGLVYNKKHGIS